ncbi:MAG: hypothetical protein M1825_006511 [Sarcosagium campestre]|nr:MAG: hypothetical protein M1825_006511 [Sarcosagium campestre]
MDASQGTEVSKADSGSKGSNAAAAPMTGNDQRRKSIQESQAQKEKATEKSESKISGAELKKRAKAEKQARRAQEKQGPNQSAAASHGNQGKKTEGSKAQQQSVKGPAKAQHLKDDGKTHHKRSGSNAAEVHKAAPITAQKSGKSLQSSSRKDSKQVALFGHLYGQSRRTSIAGVDKDVHPSVLAFGLQMSNYVICGSSARCIALLLVFKRVIESYTTPPGTTLTRHLTSHLSPQIDYLKSCRPLSISMGNAIRWLKLEISKVDISTPDEDAKKELCDAIDNFIRERLTVADEVIASSAAAKICPGDTILTYASSSIVRQTLLVAHARGTRFRVVVVDSKPLFEGKRLARSLADAGLEVQYSLMHGLAHVVKGNSGGSGSNGGSAATKLFLGAHAMMSNGGLYSRVGTAMVAMMAAEADIPVIVCCESVKFTDRVALDSIVSNEVAPPDELLPPPSLPSTTTTTTNSFTTTSTTPPSTLANSSQHHKQQSPLANWKDTPNLLLLNILYDVTPAEYINMVITEYGSLPPSSVPVVHRLSTNS